jgi:hypothetical protein
VNELLSELVTGLDSGLNARDWVNSETEESCLTNPVRKIGFVGSILLML